MPAYSMNFLIRPDKLDDLAAAIPLPIGPSLEPVRMHQNCPETFRISLNVYSVGGIVNGVIKADWNIFFVKANGDKNPSFVPLNSAVSGRSLDPVDIFF